jgi:hypothetical protein
MTNAERIENFHDTTGAFSWGGRPAHLHPHACKCNAKPDNYPGTPHTHYSEPPHACARCDCEAYDPLYPIPSFISDNYRALIALETT